MQHFVETKLRETVGDLTISASIDNEGVSQYILISSKSQYVVVKYDEVEKVIEALKEIKAEVESNA